VASAMWWDWQTTIAKNTGEDPLKVMYSLSLESLLAGWQRSAELLYSFWTSRSASGVIRRESSCCAGDGSAERVEAIGSAGSNDPSSQLKQPRGRRWGGLRCLSPGSVKFWKNTEGRTRGLVQRRLLSLGAGVRLSTPVRSF